MDKHYNTENVTLASNGAGLGGAFGRREVLGVIVRFSGQVRRKLGGFRSWLSCRETGSPEPVVGDGTEWYRLVKITDKKLLSDLKDRALSRQQEFIAQTNGPAIAQSNGPSFSSAVAPTVTTVGPTTVGPLTSRPFSNLTSTRGAIPGLFQLYPSDTPPAEPKTEQSDDFDEI